MGIDLKIVWKSMEPLQLGSERKRQLRCGAAEVKRAAPLWETKETTAKELMEKPR